MPLPKSSIRVLILDSNRMSAQLLADALRRERFGIIQESSNAADAVSAAESADVAVVSLSSSDQMNAGNLIRQLRSVSQPPRIILMIEDPQPGVVVEAFRLGIRGIFSRSTSLRSLKKCIQAVHDGQVWVNNAELHCLLEALATPQRFRLIDARGAELLSKREEDVVRCVAEGLTNREIADELDLSENTVKNYLFRIFDKLGISNRVELILYAVTNLASREPKPEPLPNGHVSLMRACREAAECRTMPEYLLADMYRHGKGTPVDKATAYMWLLIAQAISTEAQKNSRDALQELAPELSADQVADAKRRAAAWLKEDDTARRRQDLTQSAPQAA